jgi:hypothetical protein
MKKSLQKAGVRPNARRTKFCAAPHTQTYASKQNFGQRSSWDEIRLLEGIPE